MKRLLLLSLVFVSLTASAFDVPKYYLPRLTPAFSAPFIKAQPAEAKYGPLEVVYCFYQTPCNGVVWAKVKATMTDVNDREYQLNVNYRLRGGRILGVTTNAIMPAWQTEVTWIMIGSDKYCDNTIVSYSANWYYI